MPDKTIARGKLTELAGGGLTDKQMDSIAAYFGYRIIDDAPPGGVVKLAREIVAGIPDSGLSQWTERDIEQAAIAAIMHARKAAENILPEGPHRRDILRELGGEG